MLSYLALGGKCSACKTSISARYPAVEAMTGAVSGLITWHFGISGMTIAALIVSAASLLVGQVPLNLYGRAATGRNGVVAAAKPEAPAAAPAASVACWMMARAGGWLVLGTGGAVTPAPAPV